MKTNFNAYLWVIVLAVASLLVTSCGIKPDNLSAPDPDYKPSFPRTYPSQ